MNQTAAHKTPKAPKAPPELFEVEIDVPAHCTLQSDPRGGIVLDDKIYPHGTKHMVTRGVAAQLQEIMSNAWRHDDQIHGRTNENSYRREKKPRVRGF